MMAGVDAGLLERPTRLWHVWLPWLCLGVAGGVFAPVFTVLLLVMAVMAARHEHARGAWIAYLIGVALVLVPFLISIRTGLPIGLVGPMGTYELVLLCAAGLGLLVVAAGVVREHLGWWRAVVAGRRARRAH
jgi:ABC-type proline/glycine betaine transport system permease subunit